MIWQQWSDVVGVWASEPGLDGLGYMGTLPYYREDYFPAPREFPPGFAGAAPGPSREEPKPRVRVKARGVPA